MRSITEIAFAISLTGILMGCGSKDNPTQSPTVPATPPAEQLPKRETPIGDTKATPATTPGSSKDKVTVEIAKGQLSLNGTTVALPVELAIVEKLLGKPSRTDDMGLNRRIEWKELGIHGLQTKSGKQNVVQLTFSFDPFWDEGTKAFSKTFTGEIVLEGQPVNKTTNPETLSKTISALQKDMYVGWRVNYENGLSAYVNEGFKSTSAVTVSKLE